MKLRFDSLSLGSSGDYTTKSGHAYHWDYQPRRGKSPPKCECSIAAKLPVEFTLEPEGAMQRFAKWLGFATEFQTMDRTFDQKYYVCSDDPQFCQLLRGMEMRQAVETVFTNGAARLSAKKGRLVAGMREANPMPDPLNTDALVDAMTVIADRADDITLAANSPGRKYATRATIAISCLFGLLAAGIIGSIFQRYALTFYQPMFELTALATLIPFVLIAMVLQSFFKGSSRGVTVMFFLLIAGIPGIVLGSYSALFWANTHYDPSVPTVRSQAISGTSTHHSRKGGTRYYIHTPSWQKPEETLEIKVASIDYQRAKRGGIIRVYTHPGYLNVEWIERYEVSGR